MGDFSHPNNISIEERNNCLSSIPYSLEMNIARIDLSLESMTETIKTNQEFSPINSQLLSELALEFQKKIQKSVHIQNSIQYSDSFTGKCAIVLYLAWIFNFI